MNRTWDEKVILISSNGYEEDEIGQQVPRNEFYLAGQNNMEISENLIVHPYEYGGQRYIRFHGKKLKVVKTYQISAEELELTCTERIEK